MILHNTKQNSKNANCCQNLNITNYKFHQKTKQKKNTSLVNWIKLDMQMGVNLLSMNNKGKTTENAFFQHEQQRMAGIGIMIPVWVYERWESCNETLSCWDTDDG